ncbi:hypothetical protein [Akkermansia sp.]|uniref:hypothetical protein n=1 Tax=Akkermansia sp. TaxID=1872421 RepID=UPI0025C479F2|nr:hypothetical protein [Akkermansia sp.]MCC8149578.1 hypothetical protein [Akkermansia sp.]
MKKIKHTQVQTKIGTTNTRVVKIIINNSNLIKAKQMAEKIGMLKKDMKQVDSENLLNALPLVQENGEPAPILPSKKYVYFTIPVNKVKHDLYRMLFNANIKDGSLNKKTRAKITPVFEEALSNLGIEAIWVPSYVLKKNNTSSLFKAEINAPAFNLLIENARKRKPIGKTAFISEIADKRFRNAYSKNDEHPRVFNMFTQMPSSIRQHVFKNVYGVDMVEIDLTNSIVQCLASHGKCVNMLQAIKTNTLLPTDQGMRDEIKEKLLTWIFSLVSNNKTNRWITRCKNQLREFLTDDYFDEMESFIKAIDDLESPHTLFHYEDILREFCKQHSVCISLHDAVYIPADRTDLIDSLKRTLDKHKYYYKVKAL